MKRGVLKSFVGAVALVAMVGISLFTTDVSAKESKEYKSVGYVFQRECDISKIDVTKITHLNYSFGLIHNNEYEQISAERGEAYGTPKNPDVRTPEPVPEGKLHSIYLPDKVKSDLSLMGELKAKNPKLKVLLSVGGWDARGFSDVAATEKSRKIFAKSCKDVIDEYKLDGIDLDWEYPVNGGWGAIKAIPQDKENFTLLLKEVRSSIGKDKLLTIAGSGNLNFTKDWTEFNKIVPILDYINIMTYDFQYDSNYFGSALYKSKNWEPKEDDGYWCDKAIQNYINNGCPPEKINLGIAFAAPIPQMVISDEEAFSKITEKLKVAGYMDSKEPQLKAVKELLENKNDFTRNWDKDAQMAYITTKINGKDEFVLSYIDKEGIKSKANYVKEKGLGGTMFWEFSADYDNSLVTELAENLEITNKNNIENKKKESSLNKEEEKLSSEVLQSILLVMTVIIIALIIYRRSSRKDEEDI